MIKSSRSSIDRDQIGEIVTPVCSRGAIIFVLYPPHYGTPAGRDFSHGGAAGISP